MAAKKHVVKMSLVILDVWNIIFKLLTLTNTVVCVCLKYHWLLLIVCFTDLTGYLVIIWLSDCNTGYVFMIIHTDKNKYSNNGFADPNMSALVINGHKCRWQTVGTKTRVEGVLVASINHAAWCLHHWVPETAGGLAIPSLWTYPCFDFVRMRV